MSRPQIKRPAVTSSHSNRNEPDPNGDVTLVVSPSATPYRYSEAIGSGKGAFGSTTATQPAKSFLGGNAQSANKQTEHSISKSCFRVSSKVLMLASVYFRKMFSTTQWREGHQLNANGTVELEYLDTDPSALLIILNIIHLNGWAVPQYVNLGTLVELTVLTDYFGFHDALGPYPALWREGQRNNIPQVFCNDLVKWICISWVFNYDSTFTEATQIAQRQSTNNIDCLDLPIPESVSNTINTSRTTALSKIFAALKQRQSELDGEATTCTYMCESMHLGTLLKSMNQNGLSMDKIAPYSGLAVESVIRIISGFKSPKEYQCPRSQYSYMSSNPKCSVLGQNVKPEMDAAMVTLQGLVLTV